LHDAAAILFGRPRVVVEAEDGKRGPSDEPEVAHLEVALDASGRRLGVEGRGEHECDQRGGGA
jgi:hypothetical protein